MKNSKLCHLVNLVSEFSLETLTVQIIFHYSKSSSSIKRKKKSPSVLEKQGMQSQSWCHLKYLYCRRESRNEPGQVAVTQGRNALAGYCSWLWKAGVLSVSGHPVDLFITGKVWEAWLHAVFSLMKCMRWHSSVGEVAFGGWTGCDLQIKHLKRHVLK